MAGNKRIKRRIEKARKTVNDLFDMLSQLVDETSAPRAKAATRSRRGGRKPVKLTAVDKNLIAAIHGAKRGISVAELATKVKRSAAAITPRLRRLRRQNAIRARGRTKGTRYFAA